MFFRVLISIFIIFSVYGRCSQSSAGEVIEHQEGLTLKIVGISKSKKELRIKYEITNMSDFEIWVCKDMDTKSKDSHEQIIYADQGKVEVNVTNFQVPQGVYLMEPIFADFEKILPKSSKSYEIVVKIPVRAKSPIDTSNKDFIDSKSLKSLTLLVGFYDRVLTTNKDCCLTQRDDSLISVSGTWADENKAKVLVQELSL